jgi:hypothetical protein
VLLKRKNVMKRKRMVYQNGAGLVDGTVASAAKPATTQKPV